MRLIDEDAVRDVIYGMHVNGEEGVENALRNTYGADLREILYEIYELPTACDIDAIRAEIEVEKDGYPPSADEYKTINKVLQIIERHMKGDTNV